MAKFRSLKNALIGGEISPNAYGRTDLGQYAHACKTLKNMIPFLSGGAYRRPGTLFEVGFSESTNAAPYLIPFVVSQSESYMIAVYKNGGVNEFRPMRPINAFQPSTVGTLTGTDPGWKTVYDTAIEYDEIIDVQFIQSVDVMWLVHKNYKPQKLSRTAVDTFTIQPFDYNLSGTAARDAYPYRDMNTTGSTIAPSATTGTGITLTLTPAAGDSFRFQPGHVGTMFKINHTGTIGCVQITGYTSGTSVTANVLVGFASTSAVSTWWEASWSDYRGWPRTVSIFRSRLCMGGNATERDSVWFSEAGNFATFSVAALVQGKSAGDGATTGPSGDQPWQAELTSTQLNYIQWMSTGDTVTVGTQGEEWVIESLDGSVDFGANNAKAHSRTAFGSAFHSAIRVGNELISVNTANDQVRSFVFSELEQSYITEPLQALFDHFPKKEPGSMRRRFRNLCWDDSRQTLWCTDSAGNLFGMTHDRRMGVTSWHRHELGGFDATLTGADTLSQGNNLYDLCSGSVLSAAVIPNPVFGTNDLWIVVKRKINSAWSYHVERMCGKAFVAETAYGSNPAGSGYFMVDSAVYDANYFVTGSGLGETYISGGLYTNYAHLEGATVMGAADSSLGIMSLGTMTVATGVVALNTPYPPDYLTVGYNLGIGLPFQGVVEPLFADQGSQVGTTQGAARRIHRLFTRFWRTLSAKVGTTSDNVETLIFRSGDTPMGKTPELLTGLKRVDLTGDYVDADDLTAYILQDDPLPFAVTSVVAEGEVYDG